jgi:hypothetical protein
VCSARRADHYVYALVDYREVERRPALAQSEVREHDRKA